MLRLCLALLLALVTADVRAQQAAPPAAEPATEAAAQPPAAVAPGAPPAAAPAPLPNSGFLGLGVDDRFDAGRGVRVVAVHPQSPAARGGLEQQDLLIAIDGQPVTSRAEFGRMMNQLPPGRDVKLEYMRGDIKNTVPVRLGTRPADLNAVPPAIASPTAGAANVGTPPPMAQPNVQTLPPNGAPVGTIVPGGPPMLGVRTTPVTQDMQRQLGLPHSRGAYVADIVPGSPADAAGVPIGSIIWAFNGKNIDNPSEMATAIMTAGPGARVWLTLNDRGQVRRINAVLAGAKPSPGAPAWKAVDQPVLDGGVPIDADTVLLLQDQIRSLEDEATQLREEMALLKAKLRAANIDPDAP
jgi:S1-C subfamily serine protease